MQAIITRILSLSAISLALYACGNSPDSDLNLRQKNLAGLDGFGVSKLDFYFSMPDRATIEGADAKSLITGLYYKMEGVGEKCQSKEVFEATVPWEDEKFIGFPIDGACDYKLTFRAGSLLQNQLQGPELTASNRVNFQKDIRPLIEKNCASCHATWTDYTEFRKVAAQAVLDVEAGTQPPTGPLPDADIAVFLAWQDAGFQELDDAPEASVEEQKLGEIFYRNNDDDTLFAYEMLGRTFFELVRPLWIQAEGQAQGLSSKAVTLSSRPAVEE